MRDFSFERDLVLGRLVEELNVLGEDPNDVAYALGCPRSQVKDWIKGKYLPSFYYLMLMARFGCNVQYILTGERSGGDDSCMI